MPEGGEEEQEIANLLEKIMKENFPNVAKEIDFQEVRKPRESQRSWTQGGTHQGTSSLSYTRLKDKEKIVTEARGKETATYKGHPLGY